MTTQTIILTNTAWTNIVATLGLVNKKRYSLQNIGHNETKIIESTISPEKEALSHLLSPGQTIYITPLDGSSIYGRAINGYQLLSTLAITEA